MPRTTAILSISLPKKELQGIYRSARQEGFSKSQWVRKAIKSYQLQEDWEYLKKVGEKVATKFGIETEEDVERIAG